MWHLSEAERQRRTAIFRTEMQSSGVSEVAINALLAPIQNNQEDRAMPPSANRSTPAHTATIYDLCDVLDEVATTQKGHSRAESYAQQALATLVAVEPSAATKALGTAIVARFKAVADPMQTALAQAEQVHGNAMIGELLYWAASQPAAVLQQLLAASRPSTGTQISDDEKAAALKAAQEQRPFMAISRILSPQLYEE